MMESITLTKLKKEDLIGLLLKSEILILLKTWMNQFNGLNLVELNGLQIIKVFFIQDSTHL
jgi:hypothetical protein